MPTYAFACAVCGERHDAVLSIREYVRAPPTFFCCRKPMARYFDVVPGLASSNPLASERHYDGLRAQDGSDISTRAKHREYMKQHGLTTVDDFGVTWQRQARERAERVAGTDPTRAADVAQAIDKLRS